MHLVKIIKGVGRKIEVFYQAGEREWGGVWLKKSENIVIALCVDLLGLKGGMQCVTQPGGLGSCKSQREANAYWQQSIENWFKIRSMGRCLQP